jgi:hypothetical protein
MSDSGNGERPEHFRRAWFDQSHQLRLAEKTMARKTNELQDLVQEIEALIADLADLQGPPIEGLPNRAAEQNISGSKGGIAEQSGPPQA